MAGLVLNGIRLSPEKILRAGYTFAFTNIREALQDLLAKKE
jgi:NAD dependent epimerase/dehydratase family enzyme